MIPFTFSDVLQLQALVANLPVDGSVTGVRDLTGVGNNLANPSFGAVDTAFIRLTTPSYGAAEPAISPDSPAPLQRSVNPIFAGLDPRAISNLVGVQSPDTPKAASGVNMMFSAFGQYFDHGLTASPKGGSGTLTIGAPGMGRSPGSDNPADLTRSTVAYLDANGTPVHLNNTSAYIDQNQAYGANALVGTFLRAVDGQGGVGAKLMTGRPDPANPQFDLLPTLREMIVAHWDNNTVFQTSQGPLAFREAFPGLVGADGAIDRTLAQELHTNFMGSGQPLLTDLNPFISPLDHVVGGDGRANENITLTAVHTIWARNHNAHVDGLLAAGFQGTPEELFQAAKIVNETEYQRVIYTDFADVLLGGMRGSGSHGHDEYAPAVNPGISQEFAAAAYRFGHSLVGQTVQILDATQQMQDIALFDAFLNPGNTGEFTASLDMLNARGYFPQPGYAQIGVDGIVAGIIAQPAEEVDASVVDALRNDLVRISADLFSLNVARGRDLGLGTLNHVRQSLQASADPYVQDTLRRGDLDMSAYQSWEDFQARNQLSDAAIQRLAAAYPDLVLPDADAIAEFLRFNPTVTLVNGNTVKGIDRLDLWVGGLMEAHANGGVVGGTFWVIIHEQLDRLQEADRFYYFDRVKDFDFYGVVKDTGFAGVLARTTGWTYESNVFITSPLPAVGPVPEEPVDAQGPMLLGTSITDELWLDPGQEVMLVFSEPIEWQGGVIELRRLSDDGDTLLEEPVRLELGEHVQVDEQTLRILLPMNLVDGSPYALTLDPQSVADLAGNAMTEPRELTFETNARTEGADEADLLRGSLEDDALNGYEGNDWLIGRAGHDTLDGGTGQDTLSGGLGNDIYVVDDEGDVVLEGWTLDAVSGLPVVDLQTGRNLPSLDEGGVDRIETSLSQFSLDALTVRADPALGFSANTRRLAFIEELTYTGESHFSGIGNTLDNMLTGHLGNDTLSGLAGLDTLNGGAGNDSLLGGAGDDLLDGGDGVDILIGGAGADRLRGGAGADRFVLASAADSGITNATRDVILDFVAGTDKINLSQIDASPNQNGHQAFLWIADAASFTARGQLRYRVDRDTSQVIIEGNTDGNNATAEFSIAITPVTDAASLQASDFIGVTGGGGNQLQNLPGGQTLNGTGGRNTLTGSSLADSINGLGGNDTLNGGLGNDILTGGTGRDVFVFTTAPGFGNVDTITDYNMANDTIWLSRTVFTGIGEANNNLSRSAFVVGSQAADASDRIIYNNLTGALLWDVDGAGGVAAVQFAQLSTGLTMTSQEFRVIA